MTKPFFKIDLENLVAPNMEWPRYKSGYKITDLNGQEVEVIEAIDHPNSKDIIIVPLDVDSECELYSPFKPIPRKKFTPMEETPNLLFEDFALVNTNSKESILEFVNKYGLLGYGKAVELPDSSYASGKSHDNSMSLYTFLREALDFQAIYKLGQLLQKGGRSLEDFLEERFAYSSSSLNWWEKNAREDFQGKSRQELFDEKIDRILTITLWNMSINMCEGSFPTDDDGPETKLDFRDYTLRKTKFPDIQKLGISYFLDCLNVKLMRYKSVIQLSQQSTASNILNVVYAPQSLVGAIYCQFYYSLAGRIITKCKYCGRYGIYVGENEARNDEDDEYETKDFWRTSHDKTFHYHDICKRIEYQKNTRNVKKSQKVKKSKKRS